MRRHHFESLCKCIAFGALVSAGALRAESTAGSTVQSLNGLKGRLTLAAGSNVTITRSGSTTLRIGATGLTLPYANTAADPIATFQVTNSDANGDAIKAVGTDGSGVHGMTFGSGPGVYGDSSFGSGPAVWGIGSLAGRFSGNVSISGTVSKGGGSFKIDHPLDPENKYLYHSFVESPDMMNIYNGNIVLDEAGQAVVELPEWFETLNRDFRYQLTCIGGFAQVYVSEEISENRFRIAGGSPGLKVSWMVTGIRKDPFANAHRIPVEEDKPENERGYYLHPDVYGQPEERGTDWARNPALMERTKREAESIVR